jgi:FMN phosphatase YigB (HAD superfamily)
MPQPSFSIVCFDLGGVLVRICRSWKEACERANIELRDPAWVAAPSAVAARRAVVFDYQAGGLDTNTFYHRMTQALGGLYSKPEIRRIHDAWLIEDYPGAGELVSELNERPGLTTACLSNTNAAHWGRLTNPGAQAEFPSCAALALHLASHDLKLAKPNPEIFHAAHRAWGVRPAQVLFFDDTLENVLAARQVGWSAEHVDHTGDTAAQLRKRLHEYGVL